MSDLPVRRVWEKQNAQTYEQQCRAGEERAAAKGSWDRGDEVRINVHPPRPERGPLNGTRGEWRTMSPKTSQVKRAVT